MRSFAICLALLPLACGKEKTNAATPAPAVDLRLAADPGEALSVREAKEKGPGEEVVVVGRISNIVKGLATFNLVDGALPHCGPGNMPECKTPWDYCCETPEVRAAAGAAQSSPPLREAEREALQEALAGHAGSRREIARALGISERTLYRKLRHYGLK